MGLEITLIQWQLAVSSFYCRGIDIINIGNTQNMGKINEIQ